MYMHMYDTDILGHRGDVGMFLYKGNHLSRTTRLEYTLFQPLALARVADTRNTGLKRKKNPRVHDLARIRSYPLIVITRFNHIWKL